MTHIAIDYTPAIRQTAGIGRYTRGLVGALAELDRDNAYTLFCAGGRPAEEDWPANFRVRTSPLPARWLTAAWQRLKLPLPAEWLAGSADIFHSPDFTLPPLARARGVVTVHDLSFLRLPECADPGLRAYLEAAVPRSLHRADLILADSSHTRADLVELLGIPKEQISVVPGGVEARFRRVTDSDALARVAQTYSLPPRFILSVGTLEPRKNFARLIASFALLRRQQPNLRQHLVIAGKPGWLYDEIFAQVAVAGIGDCVHFAGFVADADLPALYSLADLFAFPSLYEGFGLPPLEALACGTPVVAADNSSLPETLGDAGLLLPANATEQWAATLGRVLSDPELSANLSRLGPPQAARFTWQSAAEKLIAAYRLVLGARAPAA